MCDSAHAYRDNKVDIDGMVWRVHSRRGRAPGPLLGRARLDVRVGSAIRGIWRSYGLCRSALRRAASSSSTPAPASRPSAPISATIAPDEIDILFSHLHLDHIGGLPFFKPSVLAASASSAPIAAISTARAPRKPSTGCSRRRSSRSPSTISPPASSIAASRPASRSTFRTARSVETHPARTIPAAPPASASAMAAARFCYISDIEHTRALARSGAARVSSQGSDLVIYDGMFSEAEYSTLQRLGPFDLAEGRRALPGRHVKALAIFHLLSRP